MICTYTACQGRLGFYPCDRETYLKIKRLNRYWLEALRLQAKWERWERKLPKNRVLKEKQGKRMVTVLGTDGKPQMQPEPQRCPLFGNPRYAGNPFEKDYKQARRPLQTEIEVKPLRMNVEEIDRRLAEAEKWFAW